MSTSNKATGIMLATAAAALFTSGCATKAGHHDHKLDHAGAGMVHCGGVNACKGQSVCKTATNACGGQNACKGQGLSNISQAECEAKGGTVMGNPHGEM